MQRQKLKAIGQSACSIFRKTIPLIVGIYLGASSYHLDAAPTRQQLIDYAKTTWELTDLTDDVISQTLDTSYSGIPYKDYVSYFVVAPSVLNPLLSGDYKTAGKNAADFAADQSISYLLKQAGLSGVFAPARLAAWPIEQGLNLFQNAVKEESFKNQILLYFAARGASPENTYADIVALEEYGLLSANPDILKNNRDSVTKYRYAGQLWLAFSTSYRVGSVPGYTPEKFYEYAEQQWQSFLATKSYAAHQEIIKDAFRAAAAPQKPVITLPPQDTVIASGQNATFTVQATGSGTLTYQWFFNGAWLSPAVGPSLQASAPGQYQVVVGNAAGTTPSRIATLTVNSGEPVAITAPAASANVSGSVTVRASVSGATKVEFYLDAVRQFTDSSTPYAWTWNTAIAANAPHALTAKAYNGATLLGTSAAVNVTVNNAAPPACSDPNEPNDSSPTATPLSVGVAANGYVCTTTDVDWFKVEVATPGVLTFDLTVPVANDYDIELFGPDYAYFKGSYRDTGLAENITHDATSIGTYFVRVYGYPVGNGSHNTTTPYALTVGTASGPVSIVTPPQNRNVPAGANASFSVVASGASPLGYQWQRDNTDIPGATGPTYTTPFLTVSDSGAEFRVRVTNSFGFIFSTSATLAVNTANTISWTGAAGDGNWFNRTNWNPLSVPTASDVVNINTGINVPGGAEFGVMNLTAGGSISGTFTNSGTMNWTGGSLSGTVSIGPSGVLNISGSTTKSLQGTINNRGVVTWSGSGAIYAGGAFNNQSGGLFNVQGDGSYQYAYSPQPSFNNAGTFRKSAGAGTTAFNSVTFSNTGTVEVQTGTLSFDVTFSQSAGVMRLTGGSLSGSTFNFTGGTLSGSGTVNASVVNGAVVSPGSSPGTLTINGNYTQTAAGTLQMDLAGLTPGSGFDRLVVNGQATLAGALNATLINSFTPAFSDAFPLITYNSRNGTFASINLPTLPNDLAFTAQYSSSAFMLLAANVGGSNQTNTFQMKRASNGEPELRFTGEAGRTYRLQTSSNLVNWFDISTNTLPNGLWRFLDADSADLSRRFYRTVTP